ncbi:MAG TPA: lipopolysaccharide transport periplasmic protein LptA [Steroidobacteraceae bacterium]|nr:lipopolysaccharide transport periplasmic protein LptA [Steroidobacteraceae bacterium]
MARTCPKAGARAGARALPLLAGLLATAAAAPPDFGGQPVSVDAASSEIDVRTNTLVFRNVVISQGNMRVSAEHARATGLNFANSKWNFEGNVHIEGEQRGNLRSDQAVVEFKDNHIARATITGMPAEFEQKRANSDTFARGHADEILYDLGNGTVQLKDDAWLCDGQNQISGPLLVYNIREQRVEAATVPGAAGAAGQRVHINIAPTHGRSEPTGCEPEKSDSPPSTKPPAPAAGSGPRS